MPVQSRTAGKRRPPATELWERWATGRRHGVIYRQKMGAIKRQNLHMFTKTPASRQDIFAQFIAICSSAKTCEIGENLHFVSDPL